MLWFAFKKLYLCSDEQLLNIRQLLFTSCDLLSKNCIFVLTNNRQHGCDKSEHVVICFQKIVSLFWRTTLNIRQLLFTGCDLLSKNCIFVLTNNRYTTHLWRWLVVICFQKIVSLFWRTTKFRCLLPYLWLWFAFKKLYLCSDEQQKVNSLTTQVVVICFQKIVSLFWRTTKLNNAELNGELWFAFKKLYLCSDEQPIILPETSCIGCDLLSKNCIFVLTNNTLLIASTTRWLWFAFKKLYLCSDEQHIEFLEKKIVGCDLLSKNCIFVLTNN